MEGASIEVCPHHFPMRIQKRGEERSRVENSGVVYKGRKKQGYNIGHECQRNFWKILLSPNTNH